MKKITLTLLLMVLTITNYAQTVSLVSVDGKDWATFAVETNSTFIVGQTYVFVIDVSGWNAAPNQAIVKIMNSSYGDTPNINGTDLVSGTEQVTVNFTPTEAITAGILQIRTTDTVFDGSQPNGNEYISWSITVNGATASTKDFEKENNFTMYPNPVENTIYLKGTNLPENYKITNILGKVVQQGKFEKSIDASGLSNGLYLLIYDNKTFTKFIKK